MQPDRSELASVLGLFPALRDAPTDLAERVRDEAILMKVPAGTKLFDEHAPCSGFPMVFEGAVRVTKTTPEGREILLYRVEPGESCVLTCGCLLGRVPYRATGVAETELKLIALPQALFDALITRHAGFREYIFELFSTRLTEMMLLVEEVAFRRLDQRLAALLLARGPEIHATHQALADELGSVREIISRVLGGFAHQKLVTLGREHITVTSPAGLRMIAGNKSS